jgi:hypothetical protein
MVAEGLFWNLLFAAPRRHSKIERIKGKKERARLVLIPSEIGGIGEEITTGVSYISHNLGHPEARNVYISLPLSVLSY